MLGKAGRSLEMAANTALGAASLLPLFWAVSGRVVQQRFLYVVTKLPRFVFQVSAQCPGVQLEQRLSAHGWG